MRILTSLCLLIVLTGCSQDRLSVKSETLSAQMLASYHVGTPDPRLTCPPYGERLNIRWNVVDLMLIYKQFQIVLDVRYGNLQEEQFIIPVTCGKGQSFFTLCNQEYLTKCGIQAYKLVLYADGCPIETWRHQLWAEGITFPPVEDLEIPEE